ncbi:MAG: cysteine desulfurase, SufS subfamily [Anaerocolumna sp.]|jgi:cysteine desulfurase/selenocysteine lyase|nr:cysteine desulfurase, SufS subfamily [Anaerocolumna sp.]
MPKSYRDDFPILQNENQSKPLIYFDNAATTQKPYTVLEAIDNYYKVFNANPHRGLYSLSVKATKAYEDARESVAEFIGAKKPSEIIFTRNATEALNLLAYSYGRMVLQDGDEIVISIAEHHSNIIPWQQVAKEKGAILKFLYLDKHGQITEDEIHNKITNKTKIVAVAHVSNVLGTINPIENIIEKAHKCGAKVILDCAQSIPHMEVNVTKLDVDFITFSGHKMLAPMGIGVLYGKEDFLNVMPPFMTGGEMIEYVDEQESTFAPLPQKFEAGTPNVGGAIGLAKAIEYIKTVGYDNISKIEDELTEYALEQMVKIPHIEIYGEINSKKDRCGVISFNIKDVHPHDTASILDADGIAIRAGHHCAQPLMKYLSLAATCRISFYFYNTKEEIDVFINSLKNVRRWLHNGD